MVYTKKIFGKVKRQINFVAHPQNVNVHKALGQIIIFMDSTICLSNATLHGSDVSGIVLVMQPLQSVRLNFQEVVTKHLARQDQHMGYIFT